MSIASRLLRAGVRGYQLFISPLLPPSCKFEPTCSHYALQALSRHGAVKGAALSVWRILRCNPWNEGGFDPVPPAPTCRHGHMADTAAPAETSACCPGPREGRPGGAAPS